MNQAQGRILEFRVEDLEELRKEYEKALNKQEEHTGNVRHHLKKIVT